jgi:lipopolysaccharide biosynthesis regulator YciM
LAAIIYAEILYRKNHDLKDSIEVFRKILNTDSGIKITFKCDFCSFVTEEWDDYCPECKRFDALKCNI